MPIASQVVSSIDVVHCTAAAQVRLLSGLTSCRIHGPGLSEDHAVQQRCWLGLCKHAQVAFGIELDLLDNMPLTDL